MGYMLETGSKRGENLRFVIYSVSSGLPTLSPRHVRERFVLDVQT